MKNAKQPKTTNMCIQDILTYSLKQLILKFKQVILEFFCEIAFEKEKKIIPKI